MPPLVAVPGRHLAADRVQGWRRDGVGVPRRYLDALHRAGAAEAVLLPVPLTPAEATTRLAPFDGLLLPGGGDVDPACFGAERHPEVYAVQPDSDAFELALARAALDTGTPILAVCRGLQVLNVALGGTLVQHISGKPGVGDHGYPNVGGSMNHVRVEAGTKLADALGATDVDGCCHHHQAIDRLGGGLRAVAWSDDGLVEGAELESGWVVGVQWHPEDTAADDPTQQRLFDAFVAQATTVR